MLEAGTHQGAALCALGGEGAPRIVALVSHDDRRSELPLLWQLCAAWTALGYPLIVLDATMRESEAQPGLQQLLMDSDAPARIGQGPGDWPIVAAAQGLAWLGRLPPAAGGSARLQELGRLFHDYEIVLVYARAHDLVAALPDSRIEPLLAVSAGEAALLTAYHALKQLLNIGRLRPTIISVMDDSLPASHLPGHRIGKHLQDCARDFLACEVPALALDSRVADGMHQLALRTLERAPVLPRWIGAPAFAAGQHAAPRSH